MNYSLIKAILTDTWNISPEYFVQFYPVAKSIMQGVEFVVEEEPKESIPFSVTNSGYDSRQAGNEKPTSGLISVVPLIGMMLKYNTMCGPVGTVTLAKRLQEADGDQAVIGHILLTDSGGGQSLSVDPLATTIKNLKKPIIGLADGYMASAALGVNVHCDEVYATQKHNIIGSVGTMIGFSAPKNLTEDKNGNVEVRVYSDHSPDKNLEFEEAIKGNFKVIRENLLNPLALKFMNSVKENRPGVKDEHVTGKTYMAEKVEGVFIDGIKSFNEVVERVVELAEENEEEDSNKNSQNNSNNTSTMKKFEAINTSLGVELESSDGGFFMTEEQMETMNAALLKGTTDASALVTANTAKDKAETDLATANATIVTRDETIVTKDAEIAELQKNAGAATATVITKTETKVVDDDKDENVTSDKNDFSENLAAVEKEFGV